MKSPQQSRMTCYKKNGFEKHQLNTEDQKHLKQSVKRVKMLNVSKWYYFFIIHYLILFKSHRHSLNSVYTESLHFSILYIF